MKILKYILIILAGTTFLVSCEQFEEFNQNPNEPTSVSPDVLLTSAIRSSVNTMVTESYLLGNNAAQLTAKTLRTEIDAYTWNAFPTVWEGLYESLTDVYSAEDIAVASGNQVLEGVSIVMRSWIFATLTNAYGDIPYSEAIAGENNNFTPAYDSQEDIYNDLLSELSRANTLLQSGEGNISGDVIFNNDAEKWRKFGNSLRLRLLMTANAQISDAGAQFASIVSNESIMSSTDDNATLAYFDGFPNQYPLIPLKTGDFDAVAISAPAVAVLEANDDPRLMRYARPNNDEYTAEGTFKGAVNGPGVDCDKDGASRLGIQYYNYPNFKQASELGLPIAEGVVMTYAEVEFLLAEAAAKGWISDDVETHYKAGIQASMDYHLVDYTLMGWTDFEDFYSNSSVTYNEVTDIWEQKWLALFFHGLEPYFEVRRWYVEGGNTWAGIPFLDASCNNSNNDELPMRFLYPGEEQSLNSINYENATTTLGSNSQNARPWLVQ